MATTGWKKRTRGDWKVKVRGMTIDRVSAGRNPGWTRDSDCMKYRYVVESGTQCNDQIDDRDEIRQVVADMIREIRNSWVEEKVDRDNDDLDGAVEILKGEGKAALALEALRSAGLI